MRFIYNISLLMSILCISVLGNSQVLLKDSISPITIVDKKLSYSSQGERVVSEAQISIPTNLSRLLNVNSSLYIHSTGPGGLTTAKLNANSASHSPLLWKGISLQSATNGSADLSILSSNLFNNIKIHQAGSSSLGNGLIGGAILLENTMSDYREWGITGSSMKNFSIHTKQNYIKEDISISFIADYMDFSNEYQYILNKAKYAKDKILTTQEEAANKGFNIKADLKYKISASSRFEASIWSSNYDRNIASVKSVKNVFAEQLDENQRIVLNHFYLGDDWSNKIQVALLKEFLRYKSSSIKPSLSNVTSLILSDEIEKVFNNKHRILTGFAYRNDRANTNFYNEIKTREDFSIFALYRRNFKTIKFYTNTRANLLDWSQVVLNWNVGAIKRLNNSIDISLSFNRNHNFPNLNDLYWPVLGNPYLKREIANVIHFKNNYNYALGQLKMIGFVDVFYSQLKDKIIWSVGENGLWHPTNEASVSSYGVNSTLGFDYSLADKKSILVKWNFAVNKTKILESKYKAILGKELLYTPRFKGSNLLVFTIDDLQLQFETIYVSQRYIQTDNKKSINGYWLQNVRLKKSFKLKENLIEIVLSVNNLWNQDFEVVANYAMPLRYYEFNFNYKY